MPPPRATVLATEMRPIDSVATSRAYRITISFPYMYGKSGEQGGPFGDSPDKWPVVYLLDANWYFGMVTDIVRSMAWCGGTRDAIVVGIGYPEDDDPIETWQAAFARRNFDFTAVRSSERERQMQDVAMRPVLTGGAESFHRFITSELAPFVESTYQADPRHRILAGHSLGGDFAAFALFHEPLQFETYVILSSAPADPERNVFMVEETFSRKHSSLPAKVFFGVGELEETPELARVSDTIRLVNQINSRGYEGLTAISRVFEGCNHCEVIAPAFQAGLAFALAKPE